MRAAERIVDVNVAEPAERSRECRIVCFFSGMEAEVLEHQHFTRAQGGGGGLGRRPDAVVGEDDDAPDEQVSQRIRYRPQAERRIALAVRSPEVRDHHDASAAAGELVQRRSQPFESGGVDHASVLYRDVKVGSHQHGLAGDVDAIERS